MSAEMPCQGQLRLSDRNLRGTLGPVPLVNENQGDNFYIDWVQLLCTYWYRDICQVPGLLWFPSVGPACVSMQGVQAWEHTFQTETDDRDYINSMEIYYLWVDDCMCVPEGILVCASGCVFVCLCMCVWVFACAFACVCVCVSVTWCTYVHFSQYRI